MKRKYKRTYNILLVSYINHWPPISYISQHYVYFEETFYFSKFPVSYLNSKTTLHSFMVCYLLLISPRKDIEMYTPDITMYRHSYIYTYTHTLILGLFSEYIYTLLFATRNFKIPMYVHRIKASFQIYIMYTNSQVDLIKTLNNILHRTSLVDRYNLNIQTGYVSP